MQQTFRLIFFFSFWQSFQGAGGCKCKYLVLGKKKEKSILKRSGRSVSNNANSFMGMHCLLAFAKSSFIEGCLLICGRMPGILGMAHIYINTVKCVCLSVWSWLLSCTVLSLVPSLPHPQCLPPGSQKHLGNSGSCSPHTTK